MRETITRRQFLAHTGLTLAVASTPAGVRSFAMGETDTSSEIFRPSAWFTITPDNRITVFVCKSEMGQGIHTALPILVAEELDADWSQVQIRQAPVTEEYVDPVQGSQMTYGSTSLRHLYEPLRIAAAAAGRCWCKLLLENGMYRRQNARPLTVKSTTDPAAGLSLMASCAWPLRTFRFLRSRD